MQVKIVDRCDAFYHIENAATGEAISEKFASRKGAEEAAAKRGHVIAE